jgi:hypothetical protein
MKPMLKSLRPKKSFFLKNVDFFDGLNEEHASYDGLITVVQISVRSYSFKVPELFLFLCRHKTVFWMKRQRIDDKNKGQTTQMTIENPLTTIIKLN